MTLQTFTLGTFAQQGVAAGDFDSIATVTVGSGGASSVTFNSIPSTYTHLQIRCLMRTTQTGDVTGAYLYWTYNSDTGSNYSWHVLKGDGSTVTASSLTSFTGLLGERFTTAFQAASTFGAGVIDILDYTNTNKYKTNKTLAGWDSNGSGQVALNSGLWMSTSAITRIDLYPPANNFAQYSHFALYGIKAA